jgi:hypothetical protein
LKEASLPANFLESHAVWIHSAPSSTFGTLVNLNALSPNTALPVCLDSVTTDQFAAFAVSLTVSPVMNLPSVYLIGSGGLTASPLMTTFGRSGSGASEPRKKQKQRLQKNGNWKICQIFPWSKIMMF